MTDLLWSTSLLASPLVGECGAPLARPTCSLAWRVFIGASELPNPEVLGHSSTKYHGCDGDRQNAPAL